jgi:hypothetical protein
MRKLFGYIVVKNPLILLTASWLTNLRPPVKDYISDKLPITFSESIGVALYISVSISIWEIIFLGGSHGLWGKKLNVWLRPAFLKGAILQVPMGIGLLFSDLFTNEQGGFLIIIATLVSLLQAGFVYQVLEDRFSIKLKI